ncbi:MAG: hypothetical protein B0A82_15880 [Alkalinema sp. CACIAM 70d]|nr:MAG: hypothetical protein B0A82_15880 [Alkalinema sp. CACIAM 70d]
MIREQMLQNWMLREGNWSKLSGFFTFGMYTQERRFDGNLLRYYSLLFKVAKNKQIRSFSP